MAAYPPGPSRLAQLPNYGANSAPTDRMYIVSAAQGFNAGDVSDNYITPNDFLAEITRNVSDVTLQFGDGVAAAVSAANKGKIRYNNTTKTWQVSINTGAYVNLLTGSGTATRVTFWNGTASLSSNANLYWDNVNERLGVGVGSTPGLPVDVAADATALAQQWRENGAGTARVQMQVPSSFGLLGTSSNHDFGLIANNIQYYNLEKTGGSVFGSIVPATGTVMVNALAATDVSLVANNAALSSVDIAKFQVSGSNRFRFTQNGEAIVGLAGSVDGKLTLSVSGSANTQSLQAGTSPAASNTYRWPNADPTAGQALTASAPVANVVTLSWTSVGTVTGSGTATRVAFWTSASAIGDDSNFYWDNVNKRLGIGVGSTPGLPVDVAADATALAQQWRENGAGTARVQLQVPSSYGLIGCSSNHAFGLIANNTQFINLEPTGGTVFGSIVAATGTVMINALANTDVSLVANNASGSTIEIAKLQVAGSNRFRFLSTGEAVLGLASSITGKLTLSNASGATLTSISAGNAASTLNFIWPVVDPTLGQVLSAAAPSGGNVVLSWATASGGTPGSPTNSVQYNNAGAFGGSSEFLFTPGTTSGNEVAIASAAITSGNLVSIAASGTAAASSTKTALFVSASGANATASQTTYGAQIGNTSTGTGSFNVGAVFTASGGGTNLPIAIINTNMGISGFSGGTNGMLFRVAGSDQAGIILTNFRLTNSGQFDWSSSSSITGGVDTSLTRFAAGVIRPSNGSTGIGSVLIAASTASLTGNFSVISSNAATSATYDVARFGANSSGTPAAGFGGILSYSLQSSTTADQQSGAFQWFWTNATHATRTAAVSWSLVNNATVTEYMRLTTAGGGGTFVNTAACLAVYAGTAPNIWTAGAFAAKLYLIDAAGTPATAVAANFSSSAVAGAVYSFLRGRGTNASPAAVQNADVLGDLEWWGQFNTSTNNVTAGCRIRSVATETWANGANGSGLFFYTSPTGSTIALVASLENTGTLRIGATSGSFNSTTKLQVANYASWNTDVTAAIYTGAAGNKALELIGHASQTANIFRVFRDTVTPDFFTVNASGVASVRIGQCTGATNVANVGGVIHKDTTPVSNVSTTPTDLITYTLPAATLGTNGDFIEIEAWGTTAPGGSAKQITLEFGGTTLFDTAAVTFSGTAWRFRAIVQRTGATTQIAICGFDGDVTLVAVTANSTAPAETLSGTITIKCTGTGGASSDITQEGLIVKWWPNV